MPEGGSQDLSVTELAVEVQRLKIMIGSYAHAQNARVVEAPLLSNPL